MAQKQDNAQRKKWKPGQKCEIYSRSQKNWVKGEIIEIFTDDEGEWVRVKYGRNTKEMPPNDQHLRAIASGVKWQNMTEAVRHELYPLIATTLGQSADELMETSSLKEDHLGDDAVQKVIDLMKTKKALYNNEIKYIQGMVERARKFKWEDTQSTFSCHSSSRQLSNEYTYKYITIFRFYRTTKRKYFTFRLYIKCYDVVLYRFCCFR